jgi:hypothetical protein
MKKKTNLLCNLDTLIRANSWHKQTRIRKVEISSADFIYNTAGICNKVLEWWWILKEKLPDTNSLGFLHKSGYSLVIKSKNKILCKILKIHQHLSTFKLSFIKH